ncbi:hypothetical protein VTK56DRAFT_6481 [Thermocarpiscus australiensis]
MASPQHVSLAPATLSNDLPEQQHHRSWDSSQTGTTTPCVSMAPTMEKTNGDLEPAKGVEEGPPPMKQDQSGGRPIHGIKWLLVCAALYIMAFLYGLDATIAADVQGPVIEAFGQVDQLAWIGAGFPLGSVAVQLLNGNLYGNFNLKYVYIGGTVTFMVGSAICGAAPSMSALIVGRVLAGAGGSAIYIGELNYFTLLTAPKERGLYISLIGLVWSVGAVIGPVIGGAFAESSATWRWAFYINLVIGAVGIPIYIFYLPSLHFSSDKLPIRERIARFDFLGFVLIGATWILFTVSFTLAGGRWPWSDGRTIALLVVLGILLLASIAQQTFSILTTPSNRAFPAHLLRSRTQILLFIATACATTSLFVTTYYIPIYFQFVHSDTAMQAAVRLLPYIAITAALSVASGHLLSRIRYYMPVYLIGGAFEAAGGALLMTGLDPARSQAAAIYGFTVITAVGTGLTCNLGYAVASLVVEDPASDAGHAVTLQNVSQLGSTVICLVVAGQVFQSQAVARLSAVLAGHGFGAQEIRDAVAGAQSALFRELSGDLRAAAVGAIVQAMQRAFVLVIVAGGVMMLAAAAMKRERLLFGDAVAAM